LLSTTRLVWTDFVSSHQPDDTKGEDDDAP
jgi:hypothetical protein